MSSDLPSKRIQCLIGTLVVLILMCFTFTIGIKVGERRSGHLCNWSEHSANTQPQSRGGRPMRLPFRPMPFPNGTFGRVISATGMNVVIEGQDRFQQTVVISPSTAIRTDRGAASSTEIQPNQQVSVFGTPNGQGQIEAHLIRLLPERRSF